MAKNRLPKQDTAPTQLPPIDLPCGNKTKMAATFNRRHGGYKIGLGLLLVGVVVFCVGFGTPNWTVTTMESDIFRMNINQGLWVSCAPSTIPGYDIGRQVCVFHLYDKSVAGWFKAVQALQSLALAAGLLALVYFFAVNCSSYKGGKFLRVGECLAFTAVTLGVVGLAVYGAEQEKFLRRMEDFNDSNRYLDIEQEHVSWSFVVDLVGLFIIFVATIVIGIFNKPLPADPTTLAFHAVPATLSGVHNAGFVTTSYANGVHTYIATSGSGVVPPAYASLYPPPPLHATAPPPSYATLQVTAVHGAGQLHGAAGMVTPPVVSDKPVPDYGKK